jgi:hypothetical protein
VLLAALAFWQFIPVYSSMVLAPAWVLEGADAQETQRQMKGKQGRRAWLDALTPLVWLAPYTIYVIITMSMMAGR